MRPGLLLLLLACACAGSGKRYACDPDAGDCGTVELPDGGRSDKPFVSAPITVWHDGQHDSSPDVVAFQGALYAGFRHAAAWSVDASAQVIIVRSGDKGATWQRQAALATPGRDPRQPKLFVLGGRLGVLATGWQESNPSAHHTNLLYASSSEGTSFTPLAAIAGPTGLAAWRPRTLASLLYVSVWAADELWPASAPNALGLLSTPDGVTWSAAGTPPPLGPYAREGDLLVRANGDRYLAVPERGSTGGAEKQSFCRAPPGDQTPVFACWSVPGAAIESPAIFEWNGVLFVAGKRDTGAGRKRTSIWQVLDQEHDLSLIADVQGSFGDTGGPGVVRLDADRALLTFHTTSSQDPKVVALGHEPTEVEAQSQDFAADIAAVELYLPSAAAGR